jgi:hypothetical protein
MVAISISIAWLKTEQNQGRRSFVCSGQGEPPRRERFILIARPSLFGKSALGPLPSAPDDAKCRGALSLERKRVL